MDVTDLRIPENVTVGLNEETLYFNIPKVSNHSYYKVAMGKGTNWVSTAFEGNEDNLLKITIDEWSTTGTGNKPSPTTPYRYMKILIVNNTTSEQTEMIIQQTPNNLI